MTNWQMKEEITFRCPACGNRRLPRRTSRHRSYHLVFHLNLGNRKEKYRVLLTKVQFRVLSELDEQGAYEMIQSGFWDRVVGMYTDHGCYFDAMTFDAECPDDES